MAQNTITELIDDIDGTKAEATITFAFDNQVYEIDLNAEHKAQIESALAPFIEKARKVAKTGTGTRGRKSSTPARTREENAAIRTWARENGLDVPDRGRISGEVIEAYDAAVKGIVADKAEAKPAEPAVADKDDKPKAEAPADKPVETKAADKAPVTDKAKDAKAETKTSAADK